MPRLKSIALMTIGGAILARSMKRLLSSPAADTAKPTKRVAAPRSTPPVETAAKPKRSRKARRQNRHRAHAAR